MGYDGGYVSYLGTHIQLADIDKRPGAWGRSFCELTNLSAYKPLECWYYNFGSGNSDNMQVFPGISVRTPGYGHINVIIGDGAPPPYVKPGPADRSIEVEFPGYRPTVYYLSLDVVCFRTPDGQDRSLDIKTEAIGPPGPICNLWNGSQRL